MTPDTVRAYRRVWRLLSTQPDAPISLISHRLRLPCATVVQAISYLIALGYVARVPGRSGGSRRIVVPFVVME